ncbi:hypothetical protein [Streptomyces pini]|nr:hypothetical protein [Streptomyces pini]
MLNGRIDPLRTGRAAHPPAICPAGRRLRRFVGGLLTPRAAR